jgi:hypothetical protein
MTQHISNPERASDAHALANVATFLAEADAAHLDAEKSLEMPMRTQYQRSARAERYSWYRGYEAAMRAAAANLALNALADAREGRGDA